MASIREIAKKANVAPGTVSRALNNKGYISKSTREKIEKALLELEYVPNELARNLFRNRSNMVGVILPDIEHPFFMSVIMHMVKILSAHQYHVVLWPTGYDPQMELNFLDMLRRNVVDGVVIAIPLLENTVYRETGRPIVMLDKAINGVPLVRVDHEKAGCLAAEQFAACGRKHVIVTSGLKNEDIPSYQRELAFVRRCRELGIRADAYTLEWNSFRSDYAERIAKQIFEEYPKADGILTSDLFATACYRYGVQKGIRVPQELSIISTDGIYSRQYGVVSFSSVVQPSTDIAKQAADILLHQIDGKSVQGDLKVIEPYFEQGETT